MTWPLVLITAEQWMSPTFKRLPGHCCYAPWVLEKQRPNQIGSLYLQNHAGKRPPILIVLPGGSGWCPDMRAWASAQGYHGEGWAVVGDLPNVTITPSINYVGVYHGWVQNGVITDDCEGRKF